MDELWEGINRFLSQPENRRRLSMFALGALIVLMAVAGLAIFGGKKYPSELYIDTVAAPIEAQVNRIHIDAPYYTKKVKNKTIQFYKLTAYKTKWLEYKHPTKSFAAFVKAVGEGAQYGLNPEDYHVQEISQSLDSLYDNKDRTPEDVARMDIRVTASFFLFTTHLNEGRIRHMGYGDFIWKKNIPREDDIKLLAENSSGNLYEIIDKLHPPHEQYEKLRKALVEYRKLESSKNLAQPVSLGPRTLKPGDKSAQIPYVRKRLMLTDVEPYTPDDSLLYDDKLAEAMKKFQARHGLIADGNIGATTLKYINQSFKDKADLIELNLERIRWLPHKYGDDYISVNVPEYMLRVYENGKKKLQMRVVLGTEFNATPVFNDTLEYIVFSPTWNVPESILKDEIIPDLQVNPLAYDPARFIFYQNGKEIDPEEIDWTDEDLNPEEFKIVERPGEENSLGQVKFVMPNNFNIYLHDTPAESLFKRNKRAFSHGCIRLEKPMEFAKYLLRDNNNWNEKRMEEAMQSEEPVTVHLKKKYHVEIEYRTVWVDENGLLNFREDVYGHDKRQLAMLKRTGGV
jgi:L,D-transpeptidase YcbB